MNYLNRLNILIVEDNENDAWLISRILQKQGFDFHYERIETAEDFELALNTKDWDVILSDYNIPGFGGLLALNILKRNKLDIPFILISGAIGEAAAVEIMKAGSSDYLMKDNLFRLGEVIKREIEEHKNREEKKRLQLQSEKLSKIIDSSKEIIIVFDDSEQIKYYNQSANNCLDLKFCEQQNLGVKDILTTQDYLFFKNQILPVLKNKGEWNGEINLIKQDCSIIPALFSVVSHSLQNEIEYSAIARDITERKLAEGKILEKEAELRFIVDSTQEIIQKSTSDGKLVFVNKSWCSNLGYSEKEALNLNVFDLIAPESQEKCSLLFQKVISGESVENIEVTLIGKEGKRVFLRGHSLPRAVDGKVIGTESFFLNITEKVKSEEQFRDLIEGAPDGMVITDNSGKIQLVNMQTEKLFNYAKDELVGKQIEILIPVRYNVNNIEKFEVYSDTLKARAKSSEIELYARKKDGSEFPVEISMSPIKTASGTLSCAAIRDVSERKKFQQELNQKYTELQKTNTELDKFVYSTSHDLRAPLASLLGLINLMKVDFTEEEQQQKDLAEMMTRTVNKLDDFISEILDYSRNKRMEISRDEISFEEILQETREHLKFMEGASGYKLKADIVQQGKFVTDKRRIEMVLNNLISNAIKYRDQLKENPFVNVSILCSEAKAIITISDNGIGIAPDNHEKIFEMFYRAIKTSTGSGLGLYIVKETLQKLNGTISVESQLHKGSKFIVEIPNLI